MVAINKQDLINYLKKSPENINFNIFGAMLDDFRNTYETDEEIINKIKHIIIDIVESGDDIKPTDDTINELIDILTEILPEKISGITVNESYDISEGTLHAVIITLEGDVVASIPNGVVTLGSGAFASNTTITKVIMPNSITTIEDGAPWSSGGKGCFFECNNLRTIIFSNVLNSIGNYAFFHCTGLTSVTIPDSVTSIGNHAFNSCTGLTSITIPDSVTSIGDYAFSNCTGLTSITIPDSVTSIGDYAFSNCTGLIDVYYTGTEEEWNQINIGANNDELTNATIHYNYTPSN